MRSMRYLNAVLTVIAVLLTLNLWTLWTLPGVPSIPGADSTAHAEQEGLVNAGAQRSQMIDLLKKQTQNQADLIGLLKSGGVKVKVEGGERK